MKFNVQVFVERIIYGSQNNRIYTYYFTIKMNMNSFNKNKPIIKRKYLGKKF